jgi:methionyl-tRNA synthetase
LNRYIDATAPWALFKNGETARLSSVLYTVLEHLRKVAVHLWPVMPHASVEMLGQIGASFDPEKIVLTKELDIWGVLASGVEVASSSNLFPRIDMPEVSVAAEKGKPASKKKAASEKKKKDAPAAVEVEFSDFQKLEMRLGKILEACSHPDADKLLVLKVDLGEERPRQVVAGLAAYYKPEDLPGQDVVAVVNLAPRKIRGEVSEAMLLTAQAKGRVMLLTAPGELPAGAKIA